MHNFSASAELLVDIVRDCDVSCLVGFNDNYFAWFVLDKYGSFEGSEFDIYNG